MPDTSTRERRQRMKQQQHERRRERKRKALRSQPADKPTAPTRAGGAATGKMGKRMRIAFIIVSALMALAFLLGSPGLLGQ